MNEWKYTKDETPKTKEPVAIHSPHLSQQFACWNDYEQCWDTEDGDDYLCNKEAVLCWYEIPAPPEDVKNIF